MTSKNKTEQEQLDFDLQYAANRGDVDGVKAALEKGANVDARDDIFGETALHFVSNENGVEIAKLLIDAGSDVNAVGNNDGLTPLFFVRSAEIAKVLLDAGANVNVRGYLGETPLHAIKSDAVDCGEIAQLLINAGADVNAKDEYGELPIGKALLYAHHLGWAKTLLDAGAKPASWDWALALMYHNTSMSTSDKEELKAYIKAKMQQAND